VFTYSRRRAWRVLNVSAGMELFDSNWK
jgi:hypothetical protein